MNGRLNKFLLLATAVGFGWLVVAPLDTQVWGETYSEIATEYGGVEENNEAGDCAIGTTITRNSQVFFGFRYLTANPRDCFHSYLEFDVSSIPDSVTVTNTVLKFDGLGESDMTGARTCSVYAVQFQPSATTDADDLFQDLVNGTKYINQDTFCDDATLTNNQEVDLGTSADSDLESILLSGQDWFAIGMQFDPMMAQDGTNKYFELDASGGGTPQPTLEVTYDINPTNWSEIEIEQTIGNIGDTFKIDGTIDVKNSTTFVNITSIVTRIDGTIVNTNSTNHNQSAPYTISFGTVWERTLLDGLRNITTTVITQANHTDQANETKTFIAREYDPDYKRAVEPTLGSYNFTVDRINDFDTVHLKVNRISAPSGDTWPLNCVFQTGSQALRSVGNHTTDDLEGTWHNTSSNVGYLNLTAAGLQNVNVYGECQNPHQTVFHFTSYTNGSLVALGIQGLDDLYGGFVGVPIGILFVAFFAYMATPKTAPTYTIFVVALLALIAAAGFVTLTDNTWGLIIIGAAVGLLVKKLL